MRNNGFVSLYLVIVISLLLIVGYFIYRNSDVNNKFAIPITNTQSQTSKPALPDFSKNVPVERNVFDTSNWKTYSNKEIGLTFKYPPTWVSISDKYRVITPESGLDCFDKVSCAEFKLIFGNDFMVYGRSEKYMPGQSDPDEYSHWNFPETDFCAEKHGGEMVHCQTIDNTTDVTRFENTMAYNQYVRFHLIRVSNKKISGLTFGGPIDFSSLSDKYSYDLVTDRSTILKINKALVERKLPKEIMYNFDLYEKVFETISIY